ncbi:MAG: SRPBCC family protein [Streptosporangiaceae bacterium]
MFQGQITREVPASPDAVCAKITDLAGLPSWNAAMTAIVEQPERLEPGAEWVVEFHIFGRTWRSRACCEVIDSGARRFTYRTLTDDGNPSHSQWRWEVDETDRGAEVRVHFELYPVTFWRRFLLGRVRARQLARRELPASLAALSRVSVGATH